MISTSLGVTSLAIVVGGYLLGAVPFGLLVARWHRGIDIRRYGSGSTGATNVLRTLGWRASAFVFGLDLAKSIIPVLVAKSLTDSAWVESATGVAVIVGHCWSVYTGWSGGRGVTSTLGGILVIQPLVGLGSVVVLALIVARTRFVSLGSLLGVAFGAVAMAVLIATHHAPVGDLIYLIGAPLVVYLRHLDNIRRLLAGTEHKLGQTSRDVKNQAAT